MNIAPRTIRTMLVTRQAAVGLGLMVALLVSLTVPALTPSAAPLPAGSRIAWRGGSWYLHGANVPWYNWGCDFGCNANGGVSSNTATLGAGFAKLKGAGIKNARWWVFPGDPWQITRDGAGAPTGLNPAIYADFDAALQLAETYDLTYDFVLFAGPTSVPTAWMTDAGQRAKLAAALSPLFARYKDHPRILSWEVVNEPEWDIWNNRIGQAAVQETVKAVAAAVHSKTSTYVTVGAANVAGLPLWKGLGLDYYRAHWYDHMTGDWCARCTDYPALKAKYGLDAPVVIGEYYAGSDVDALKRHEDWYAKGYAGATAWSLFADRTHDRMAIDFAAAATFAGRHGDIGPRSGGAPPPPTATAAPPTSTPPAATPTATVKPTNTPAPATATATAPAGPLTFVTGAGVSAASVAPGQAVTVTASVTANGATTALVDVEIYDPAWNKVHQRFFDNETFTADARRDFRVAWTVPANAAVGRYTVMIGVFKPGWNGTLSWNGQAGGVSVMKAAPTATATAIPPTPTPTKPPAATGTPTPKPAATATPRPANTPAAATATPAALSFATGARVSAASVKAGQAVTITASVTATRATSALVDIEVYDAAGKKVHQRFYDNQAFGAGVKRTFTAAWTPPKAGAYTVKVGVFKPGWGVTYAWNDKAATFAVAR
jgi:hypothetical protein